MEALLAAAWIVAAQPVESLARVPAARLASQSVRSEPASTVADLEKVPLVVRAPDNRRTARVQALSKGLESQRARITIVGPGARQITLATVVNYFGLAWSPDGAKVAFAEGAVVTIADADGTTRRVIYTGPGARYPGACFDLKWSGDGRTLSCTQVENAGQLDLSRPVRVSIRLGVRPGGP